MVTTIVKRGRLAPLSVAIGGLVFVSSAVSGAETPENDEFSSSEIVDVTTLEANAGSSDQVANVSSGMEQVTSVSQLTDVKPTDWAF